MQSEVRGALSSSISSIKGNVCSGKENEAYEVKENSSMAKTLQVNKRVLVKEWKEDEETPDKKVLRNRSVNPKAAPRSPLFPLSPSKGSAVSLDGSDGDYEIKTPKISPSSRSTVRSKKQELTLPKLHEDPILKSDNDYEMKYSIILKEKSYILEPLFKGETVRDHKVWKAESEGKEFIAKSFWHLNNKDQRHRISTLAIADTDGHQDIKKIIQYFKVEGIRIAELYSNPKEDGIVMMEYVKSAPEMSHYWNQWQGNCEYSKLTQTSKDVLTKARCLLELMWKEQADVGDFKPENVVVTPDGQLVIIDWTMKSNDLVGQIQLYIDKWSKNNESVKNFLYENMPDLKCAAKNSSFVDLE